MGKEIEIYLQSEYMTNIYTLEKKISYDKQHDMDNMDFAAILHDRGILL